MIGFVLGTVLVIAAWSDWKHRKISNWLVFPTMVTGFAYQAWTGPLMNSLGGIACGFAIAFIPVILRSMGMGDQKLLMAIGAWTGPSEVFVLFLLSALLCVVALLFVPHRINKLWHHFRILAAGWKSQHAVWLPSIHATAMTIPFAVPLSGAYLIRQIGGMLA